jgi:hypothetical protein
MDLIPLLDQFARDINPPRGDEQQRHVSDLCGCDRATWARMHGWLSAFDPDTLRKFGIGFHVEGHIVSAIGRSRPDLILGARVVMRVGIDGIEGCVVSEEYQPHPWEIVGHPDGILDDAIIECKSTEFMVDRNNGYARIVPLTVADLQWHYRIQAGAYALALGKPRCVVIIVCRASGQISAISFNPKLYETEIIERMHDVLAISEEEPQPTLHRTTINAKTGKSWLCKYCLYEACELNTHQPVKIEGREVIEL